MVLSICFLFSSSPSFSLTCLHSLSLSSSPSPPPPLSTELEALGDEYLGELDEDAGFLDAAVAAPDPPSGVPGGKGKVQVQYYRAI